MQKVVKKCATHAKRIKTDCVIVDKSQCNQCGFIKNYRKAGKAKLSSKKYYDKNKKEILKKAIDYRKSGKANVNAKKHYYANKVSILKRRTELNPTVFYIADKKYINLKITDAKKIATDSGVTSFICINQRQNIRQYYFFYKKRWSKLQK